MKRAISLVHNVQGNSFDLTSPRPISGLSDEEAPLRTSNGFLRYSRV